MDQPVERLFTFRDEYDAASARQRVWVRYKDMRGNETDRKIEIYYPQDDEYVFAWCCLKNEPRTFSRRKIQAWQLLDEQFQFDPLIERYWLLTKLKTAEAPQTIRRPMGKKP